MLVEKEKQIKLAFKFSKYKKKKNNRNISNGMYGILVIKLTLFFATVRQFKYFIISFIK